MPSQRKANGSTQVASPFPSSITTTSTSKKFKPPLLAGSTRTSAISARTKIKNTRSYNEEPEDTSGLSLFKRACLGTDRPRGIFKRVYEDPIHLLSRTFRVPFADPEAAAAHLANPSRNLTLGMLRKKNAICRPLHDPDHPDAIVLWTPPEVSAEEKLAMDIAIAKGEPQEFDVAIVVDPILAKVLRPHQIEGVQFMWECVTGKKVEDTYGCIMADEMGLGKTLQCITLLWTLLKQSPNARVSEIEKCLIVCPSSLVKNWANELVKWLGPQRVNPLACGDRAGKVAVEGDLTKFAQGHGRSNGSPILIVSYETLRANAKILGKTPIGLLLCDEGHRLKNSNSQTFEALNALNVQRRVILSGTPIQNDLSEYFSLLNFANPNLLGTPMEFRRTYEIPILRGRDADASESERTKSDELLLQLTSLASKFIIRRTNDILSKYLPIKYEHVVFCRLSPLQLALYNHYIKSGAVKRLLDTEEGEGGGGGGLQPLKAIMLLKKLCNDPRLLTLPDDIPGSLKIIPSDWVNLNESANSPFASSRGGRSASNGGGRQALSFDTQQGKMAVLDRMLRGIKDREEKVVLISNYTQTLDLFERLCADRRHLFLRLDGTMTVSKRQALVEKFNDPDGQEFIFLLSSKAGGCGLNLIGANRLILFDPDWNPAADQQALARVWRDGQRKACFVYRLIATGTIEEKVFQRQTHKQSLSSCVVDAAEDVERHFSLDGLRNLFEMNESTVCETHDVFKCKRCVAGTMIREGEMAYGDTSTWSHFREAEFSRLVDPVLKSSIRDGSASFVFQYKSHEAKVGAV